MHYVANILVPDSVQLGLRTKRKRAAAVNTAKPITCSISTLANWLLPSSREVPPCMSLVPFHYAIKLGLIHWVVLHNKTMQTNCSVLVNHASGGVQAIIPSAKASAITFYDIVRSSHAKIKLRRPHVLYEVPCIIKPEKWGSCNTALTYACPRLARPSKVLSGSRTFRCVHYGRRKDARDLNRKACATVEGAVTRKYVCIRFLQVASKYAMLMRLVV